MMLSPNGSYWLQTPRNEGRTYDSLNCEIEADVCVIGGGITGLSCAWFLQTRGLKVAVLEARYLGCGTTGHTTAKLTALHGMKYASLLKKYDEKLIQEYAEANTKGIETIAAIAEQQQISCDFERQMAYTYTTDAERVNEIKAEVEAAKRAGLPAQFFSTLDLPFTIKGAVGVFNQAQMHPMKYCYGLAERFVKHGGQLYENARVLGVRGEGQGEDEGKDENYSQASVVKTASGSVRAKYVVFATLLPIIDRSGCFARTTCERSYAIMLRTEEPPPAGMYINIDEPRRSIRPMADKEHIIIGGENHIVGHMVNTHESYERLEAWARTRFAAKTVEQRWSAQDYVSADALPFIGVMPFSRGKYFLATGFGKWGLSTATFAGMLIADLIAGKKNPWAEIFDPMRLNFTQGLKEFSRQNLEVATCFVADRLKSLLVPDVAVIKKGQAGMAKCNGHTVAAYRDTNSKLHLVSPICTHMGCMVKWNSAERSWDCPCHGSRFGFDGEVLQGPAISPLGATAAS